jgi:hypothetical protein
MSIQDILHYLRISVNVQMPDGSIDPAYLSMTDDELMLYLKLGLSQPYFYQQGITELEDVTGNFVYALVLYAKRELYTALAVRVAKDVSMSADSVSMSKSQRYDHYADLARQCNSEIEALTNGSDAALGGTNGVAYTYTYGTPNRPIVSKYRGEPVIQKLTAKLVGDTSALLTWMYPTYSASFKQADVYMSQEPIVLYRGFETFVSDTAEKIGTTKDLSVHSFMVNDLEADTHYYFAVAASDTKGKCGYAQTELITPGSD